MSPLRAETHLMAYGWLLPLLLSPPAAHAAGNPCPNPGNGKILVVAASGAPFKTAKDALAAAQPGDTVILRTGRYPGDIEIPRSGRAGACITLRGEKGAEIVRGKKGIVIRDKEYVLIQGLTIRNMSGSDLPEGISVTGASRHIAIVNNVVKNIDGSNSKSGAHGMHFLGTSSQPMQDIFVSGNEISGCKLGPSESLTLNGNLEGFLVTGNRIHDNDNIGIDVAGGYGAGSKGQDFAHDGTVSKNQVWNISSANNPAYHGDRSADGIYVDGGHGVLVEGNRVADCDVGIELASENPGWSTEAVIARGNQVSGSFQGNLMMGGYDEERGKTIDVHVEGNVFANGKDGEIIIQNFVNGASIKGNTFQARPGNLNIQATGNGNDNIDIQGNHYAGKIQPEDLAAKDGTFRMISEKK